MATEKELDMEKEYKNIIFDLGNVLVRLDSDGCMKAFADLGLGRFLSSEAHPEGHELMHSLCLGLISTEEFCDKTRTLSGLPLSDEQIKDAANKMLVDIPDRKKEILLQLRSRGKKVYLLSNTLDIHWDYCVSKLFPYKSYGIDDYFDMVFLSQRLHMEKPSPEIYREVVSRTEVKAEETLFIDDLEENCVSAQRSVGWDVFQNKGFDDWLKLCQTR